MRSPRDTAVLRRGVSRASSSCALTSHRKGGVCVGFRDHIVQRMELDDDEDHEKNWNDTDNCACQKQGPITDRHCLFRDMLETALTTLCTRLTPCTKISWLPLTSMMKPPATTR